METPAESEDWRALPQRIRRNGGRLGFQSEWASDHLLAKVRQIIPPMQIMTASGFPGWMIPTMSANAIA